MAGELPGMNVMAVVMNAPMEIMNLATRQATETMGIMSNGVAAVGMELSKPPMMPQGLALPPLPGVGGPTAAPTPAPEPKNFQMRRSRLIK